MPRNLSIDSFRGLLFFPMFIFHLVIFYDLKYNTNNISTPYINVLGNVRILYILLAGASLYLYKKKYGKKSFEKKLFNKKMLFSIIIITILSHCLYPGQGIKFGILHFIFLASLIVCGIDDNYLNYLILAIFIIKNLLPNLHSTILGPQASYASLDWFPLLTHISLFITGYHIGKILYEHYDKIPNFGNKTLAFIGKNSLEFYVGHFILLMMLSKCKKLK